MKTRFPAYYYDGRTAERHDAVVTLSPQALSVQTTGSAFLWPLGEFTRTQGFHDNEPVRLERDGAALIIPDTEFIPSLMRLAPGAGAGRQERSVYLKVVAGGVALVSVCAFLYLWAIPWACGVAADRLPPETEEELGSAFVEGLAGGMPECGRSEANDAVDAIMERLDSAAPPHPYTFRVHILKNHAVNAYAAPGGHIVVFTGLLEATGRPEELAGVLSHEMQHVLKKHATKRIFQSLSTRIFFSIIFGDVKGVTGAAEAIGELRYSRAAEEEADRAGAELMIKAGIDPRGLVDFFKRIEDITPEITRMELFRYVSTHPLTADRIRYVRELSAGAGPTAPLLPGTDWKKVRTACR